MKTLLYRFGCMGLLFGCSLYGMAQTAATPEASSSAGSSTSSPISLNRMRFSGYFDGYYSYNQNRPSNAANGQINDLYNFNDKTDQFNLSMLELTLNEDPKPVGVHVDLIFGRANTLMHTGGDQDNDKYIEQAYVSVLPPRWHGTEIDLGQFDSAAGAEVIEAAHDWNYSRSLLFSLAIPYYHFGLRTTTPVTSSWTAGVQLVNGWNDVTANNGGVTVGLTSLYTRPKYNWALNYYVGPQGVDTQHAIRNLIDTTLVLTPTQRFNTYINYDYGQNHTSQHGDTAESSAHWQGVAVALHEQLLLRQSVSLRGELYSDRDGYTTGKAQQLKEITATYEYDWTHNLLSRLEYRHDWSNQLYFHRGDTGLVEAQSTLTASLILNFGTNL